MEEIICGPGLRFLYCLPCNLALYAKEDLAGISARHLASESHQKCLENRNLAQTILDIDLRAEPNAHFLVHICNERTGIDMTSYVCTVCKTFCKGNYEAKRHCKGELFGKYFRA